MTITSHFTLLSSPLSLHLSFSLLPSCPPSLPSSPGTAAAGVWTILFRGRLFHSGLPHKGINSIELASEAMAYIQRRFYEDFPPVSVCVCTYSVYSHTRLLHPPTLPCGYITLVLVCACVYDCVCVLVWW